MKKKKSHESSLNNINEVLYNNKEFTESHIGIENSFYEIVSSISAKGIGLNSDEVVKLFDDIVSKKRKLTGKSGAWEQYVQFASWLTYLGSLIDIKGTSMEKTFLESVRHSMNTMSKSLTLGRSWHAYKVWDARWNGITTSNRALIREFILEKDESNDATEIVSRL